MKWWLRGAAALLVLVMWVTWEVRSATLVPTTLAFARWPGDRPLTVVQVSDVHDAQVWDEPGFFAAIKAAHPDLIALTGDLVDRETVDHAHVLAFAEALQAIAPVYFVSGNHEHWHGQLDALLLGLRGREVTVLENAWTTFTRGPLRVTIAGVDDPYTHHDDVAKALTGADLKRFTILLAHDPAVVRARPPVDLVLAGHTHGGQVAFPGFGALWAPGQGVLPEYDRGVFARRDAPHTLYVDSGLGTSILPIRLFARAQASVLTISR